MYCYLVMIDGGGWLSPVCIGSCSEPEQLLSVAGDRELIQEVLFDAVVTAPLEAYWTGLALNKSEWVLLTNS